ncbi:MAG TPA: winged helix-turn-helix transcriptional regulator [Mucilaginibacter sp.]|jgi:DNA-binding HxlR family transcriptional regulator|nr:winged helix-turn-helix transcriptional regulator [Mucilaginibacter sp.]
MNKIGGKWKLLIIFAISKNCNRFSKLQKAIPFISKQMLVNQLRELEEDKLISRTVFAEVPPRVEYDLTLNGEALMPVINELQVWGTEDLKRSKPA